MSSPTGPMRMSLGGGPLSVAHRGLFPQRREHDGSASQPEPHELARLTADAVKLAEVRKRLANISWIEGYRPRPFSSLIGRRSRLIAMPRRTDRAAGQSGRHLHGSFWGREIQAPANSR